MGDRLLIRTPRFRATTASSRTLLSSGLVGNAGCLTGSGWKCALTHSEALLILSAYSSAIRISATNPSVDVLPWKRALSLFSCRLLALKPSYRRALICCWTRRICLSSPFQSPPLSFCQHP